VVVIDWSKVLGSTERLPSVDAFTMSGFFPHDFSFRH
jgi:hypothetical protein